MAKLFNFRCPDELMATIEETASAKGASKSVAATMLIELGSRALKQGADISTLERKTVDKTISDERKTVESCELAELEERLMRKTKEMIEVSYATAMAQFNGMVETLREEFSGLGESIA